MTFDWQQATQGQPVPSTEGGESGYFSSPSATLDPHLFDGERLRIEVGSKILTTLWHYLTAELHLEDVPAWASVWLAGSGITYQWSADRGNGDLDVLIGIHRGRFDRANPGYAGYDDTDLAATLNAALKAELWPRTRAMNLGGQQYEVTFYYNAGTGDDIERIHPYAAYDVKNTRWIVRPPKLPHDPVTLYPKAWFAAADQDARTADSLVTRYNEHMRNLNAAPPGTPGHVNAGSALNLITSQAQALLTDIHHGRQIAFQGGGRGYRDWHNFRWQMAKASGAVKGLSGITGIRDRAREISETELYGSPLAAADELVRRASQHYGSFPQ